MNATVAHGLSILGLLLALWASTAIAAADQTSCLCQTIEDPRSPLLTIASSEPLGDSGRQRVFPNFKSRCENIVLPFSHAELVTKRQRFGQATITRMPEPGCTNCAPIEVHWLHEPTGHLEAELRIFRQIRHRSCCPG
ncbi:MAG: hypothetical protein AB8B93_13905 [Pseudomonadales bacterium]